ncbi:alpha/beta hydrolase [Vagococcus sp. BWB3-3]|uniref:Alpha/beta hydrolase n=1 Tax=Vagococcus allomyrinae TaxID=2794353 RepID=A0A940SWR1_9ENTE|nr:alpha/beta hydrolase [Vagococcus allomyrinae]MBP1043259.1 alpha/beta hydrolase [Vagococcus allomyrinae]
MKKYFLKLSCCLALFLSGCSSTTQSEHANTIEQPTINLSKQIPILFLHGSGGSENDLIAFAESITDDQAVTKLMVTIDGHNHLTYLNQLSDKNKRPFIFIGFKDNNAAIEDWSKSLATLLQDLTRHYQFQTINLVGFSNGGLAAGYFAETHSEYHNLPSLDKLVMIGAPFNDLTPLNNTDPLDFNDLSTKDTYFDKFLQKKEQLPSDLNVLAIAGDIGDASFSDSVVPISSAFGSRLIFPDHVRYYEEQLSYGQAASHVGLISDNKDVSNWVKNFLFVSKQTGAPQQNIVSHLKKR